MIPTIGRRGTKRLVSALTAGMAVLLIAAACGGDSEKTVTGLIVEAVERDLVEIELLRVRDDDGRQPGIPSLSRLAIIDSMMPPHWLC